MAGGNEQLPWLPKAGLAAVVDRACRCRNKLDVQRFKNYQVESCLG